MSQINPTRAALVDSALRIIDVAIAVSVFLSGFAAILNPPSSVLHAIEWPWLIYVWGTFLLLGGAGAALGRLTGFWFPEATGLTLTMFGTLIYIIVVMAYAKTDVGAFAVAGLIIAALGAQIHRYVQIQVFISEPTDRSILARLFEMMRLRTAVRTRKA